MGKVFKIGTFFLECNFDFIAIRFKIQADPISKRVRFNNTKKDLEFTVNATKEQQCIDIEQLYLVLNEVSASLNVSKRGMVIFSKYFLSFGSYRACGRVLLLRLCESERINVYPPSNH